MWRDILDWTYIKSVIFKIIECQVCYCEIYCDIENWDVFYVYYGKWIFNLIEKLSRKMYSIIVRHILRYSITRVEDMCKGA